MGTFANGCLRRDLVIAGRSGEGPFTIRFADVRYRALSPAGFWVKLLAAFLADLATKANAASALSKTR
jgi:hypothetical protein